MAHQLARKCEIQVAYAIGKVKPISILLDTFGTGTMSDEDLLDILKKTLISK